MRLRRNETFICKHFCKKFIHRSSFFLSDYNSHESEWMHLILERFLSNLNFLGNHSPPIVNEESKGLTVPFAEILTKSFPNQRALIPLWSIRSQLVPATELKDGKIKHTFHKMEANTNESPLHVSYGYIAWKEWSQMHLNWLPQLFSFPNTSTHFYAVMNHA